jgi:hypothetical protein
MAGFELVLYNPSNKAESSFSVGSGILDLYVAAPFGVQALLFDVAHKSSLQSNFFSQCFG